jgi:hypothetical protein
MISQPSGCMIGRVANDSGHDWTNWLSRWHGLGKMGEKPLDVSVQKWTRLDKGKASIGLWRQLRALCGGDGGESNLKRLRKPLLGPLSSVVKALVTAGKRRWCLWVSLVVGAGLWALLSVLLSQVSGVPTGWAPTLKWPRPLVPRDTRRCCDGERARGQRGALARVHRRLGLGH